jgi:membrane associated rhomboid family serine protease
VFATLGLLTAHGWRRRHALQERWAYRYSPLVAGIAMLAFLGAGGERTDVLAHLTGFVVGAIAGLWQTQPGRRVPESQAFQLVCGGATLAAIAAAWWLALSSAG